MSPRRNTKIIATLGPATATPERIHSLFEAGADLFRLNMSHGSHEDKRQWFGAIRQVEQEVGKPIGVLFDLQGPKIRIGQFKSGKITLREGDKFRFDLDSGPGDEKRVELPHPEIIDVVEKDSRLLLDDGRLRLRAVATGKDFVDAEVEVGGPLSDRKGLNLPGIVLPVASMTQKDSEDLELALDLGADWLALSFVQTVDDVRNARDIIGDAAGLMAKIEKPTALGQLDEILDTADAVMVARGDLGVEMPLEDIPIVQKQIVRDAHRAGKAVVVATQMLESMIQSPVPTRAEVSDVANAVFDGADAVMLSAESAIGDFPIEAVQIMDRIARNIEEEEDYRREMAEERWRPEPTSADAITAAARQVAETLSAAAIVCYTTSGSTGLRASRERPAVPILALTPRQSTARRWTLSWGLHWALTEDATDFDDMVEKACHIARREGFARTGDRIVVTAGVPFGTPGATNVLRIARVRE